MTIDRNMLAESMPIAVRAYAVKTEELENLPDVAGYPKFQPITSEWALIFDTETTTDATQRLRFGSYQVRKGDRLDEPGLFYDEAALTPSELKTLKAYAVDQELACLPLDVFVADVIYRVGYDYRGAVVGFNLPFDISRLALDAKTARYKGKNKLMRGGFTFQLSESLERPRVQIKHISSRSAFIQFAGTHHQRTARSKRKKKRFEPVTRGCFIDCKTLAAALTSQSHSLDSLAKRLKVSQKQSTEEHGQTLTATYIDYALQDTQTTWECYQALMQEYQLHGLSETHAHQIYSEASLGKAYLKEMGIQPWRALQPDCPPALLGKIMSAYYGGRSEVHIRKQVVQVLYCDFLSMYPTVCTLMGLWRFVVSQGMHWSDDTQAVRDQLEQLTLDQLQDATLWQNLTVLVKIKPDNDIFPVRARYVGDAQYTIGANYLTSEEPLWFTLADCMASKLLTGKTPQVLEALRFTPADIQADLKPVQVAGNPDYTVDPRESDFFKRVIDLRQQVKAQMASASPEEQATLDSQQLALKILANATSYGIFVELNVEEEKLKQDLTCFGPSGEPIPVKLKKHEVPGRFYHPLLAALITGAARLKLAITEKLAADQGLDWAFCDTDSMALAKPESMTQDDFYARCHQVREWFTPLNPYAQKAPLLKVEDENYSLDDPKQLEPLYCLAISSKRYALFNLDADNQPILRKASEHGLGHLLAPSEKST